MQELVHLIEFLAEAFCFPCVSFSMLDGPGGTALKMMHMA
jgi:hypothetical protein